MIQLHHHLCYGATKPFQHCKACYAKTVSMQKWRLIESLIVIPPREMISSAVIVYHFSSDVMFSCEGCDRKSRKDRQLALFVHQLLGTLLNLHACQLCSGKAAWSNARGEFPNSCSIAPPTCECGTITHRTTSRKDWSLHTTMFNDVSTLDRVPIFQRVEVELLANFC